MQAQAYAKQAAPAWTQSSEALDARQVARLAFDAIVAKCQRVQRANPALSLVNESASIKGARVSADEWEWSATDYKRAALQLEQDTARNMAAHGLNFRAFGLSF